MFSDIDPMMITLAVVAVAVVGSIIGVARRGRSEPAPDRTALPAGADAALWSITEVLPDPRNHLAIKDPTSELRLTARERADAAAAAGAAPPPAVRPAEAARSAQSLAARRAALAKRGATPTADTPTGDATSAGAPEPAGDAGPVVLQSATSPIELTRATPLDQPLTIVLDDPDDAAARHLTLLPEETTGAPAASDAPPTPRWGETPARAS